MSIYGLLKGFLGWNPCPKMLVFILTRSALRLQWLWTGLTKHFRKTQKFLPLPTTHRFLSQHGFVTGKAATCPAPLAPFGVREEHHHPQGREGPGHGVTCLISAPVPGLRNQSPPHPAWLSPCSPWAGSDGFGIDFLPSLPRVLGADGRAVTSR